MARVAVDHKMSVTDDAQSRIRDNHWIMGSDKVSVDAV